MSNLSRPADEERLARLIGMVNQLSNSQIFWLEKALNIFNLPTNHECFDSDLFSPITLNDFGEALRFHHAFSAEPFSKDKFEYVLEQVLRFREVDAKLAPKGTPGHDIVISGIRFNLKTQANKGIQKEVIWISKFMELGKGNWGCRPGDLIGLREAFLSHLQKYDRILTLRSLGRGEQWIYELVEIPKTLLQETANGELKMMRKSKQRPKPGYCFVRDEVKEVFKFRLYFDGGTERKLQIKGLRKEYCRVHAVWRFSIPKI